jgi:hypothetical protein
LIEQPRHRPITANGRGMSSIRSRSIGRRGGRATRQQDHGPLPTSTAPSAIIAIPKPTGPNPGATTRGTHSRKANRQSTPTPAWDVQFVPCHSRPLFRWAIAAELLTARATRIVPGPRARDLERDLLSAWFVAASIRLGYGLLDGFQRGWRKVHVELLDAGAGPILAAILKVGGQAPLTAIEELAWERVASSYGYTLDDGRRASARRPARHRDDDPIR